MTGVSIVVATAYSSGAAAAAAGCTKFVADDTNDDACVTDDQLRKAPVGHKAGLIFRRALTPQVVDQIEPVNNEAMF